MYDLRYSDNHYCELTGQLVMVYCVMKCQMFLDKNIGGNVEEIES